MPNPDVRYTDIDLNSTGSTDIYTSEVVGRVFGVYLEESGTSSEVALEVTDGTDTARITEASGGGTNLEYEGPIGISNENTLQINVTKAEGSPLTGTCVVFFEE